MHRQGCSDCRSATKHKKQGNTTRPMREPGLLFRPRLLQHQVELVADARRLYLVLCLRAWRQPRTRKRDCWNAYHDTLRNTDRQWETSCCKTVRTCTRRAVPTRATQAQRYAPYLTRV